VEIDPEILKKTDPLALTNTITLSALVAILSRKGLLEQDELAAEIRQLRARMGLTGQA
jgi:hypothetical protein